jgi:hypothetical protein
MALIAKGGKAFTPPPEGLWDAVAVDVIDLGMVDGQWGEKHKCRIVWEISELMSTGLRYLAQKQYTVSLHEKAALYKDLKAWRGKPFTAEELEGFDLEAVVGAPCQLLITIEEKDGTQYGNITAIMKAKKKMASAGTYVRVKDREGAKAVDEPQADPIVDDDIPF